jgi:leucyl aminopeptidase
VPEYFESIAENFAKNNDVKLTIIKGEELLKNGFRLMHAVGRASIHPPTFINLSYNGNPDSD